MKIVIIYQIKSYAYVVVIILIEIIGYISKRKNIYCLLNQVFHISKNAILKILKTEENIKENIMKFILKFG